MGFCFNIFECWHLVAHKKNDSGYKEEMEYYKNHPIVEKERIPCINRIYCNRAMEIAVDDYRKKKSFFSWVDWKRFSIQVMFGDELCFFNRLNNWVYSWQTTISLSFRLICNLRIITSSPNRLTNGNYFFGSAGWNKRCVRNTRYYSGNVMIYKSGFCPFVLFGYCDVSRKISVFGTGSFANNMQ